MTFRPAAFALFSGLLIGACSPGVIDEHPQLSHCKSALGWLVSPDETVQLMASERSVDGDAAQVVLGLRVDGREQTMTCRYQGPSGRLARRPEASAILIGEQPLSEPDLEAVNRAVKENRDPLRNVRRAFRTG
jgi:hypothetical protein